jgi:hypothetical protein
MRATPDEDDVDVDASADAGAVEQWFLIRLDLERIRLNLVREDGRTRSGQDVRAWLGEAGFRPAGAAWLVRESDVGHVQPAEVTAIEEHELPVIDE